jgi:serine/threonine protein kinase
LRLESAWFQPLWGITCYPGFKDIRSFTFNLCRFTEATAAWAEAVPDEGSAGEEVTVVSGGGRGGGGGGGGSSSVPTRGWRRVGDTIIYNEEEVIGVGSSGTYVFRGYVQHTTRARHAVAVKRIARPPGEEGRELLKLVEREIELLTALNQSPRVPFFHCWGVTSSHVFIALELCTESLREHVTRQGAGMSVRRRMDILRSVAGGIAW